LNINILENYLTEVLYRASVDFLPDDQKGQVPLFAAMNYELALAEILGSYVVIVIEKKYKPYPPSRLAKEAKAISSALNMPVAFAFDHIEPSSRKRLIELQVPFIVPGKFLNLPFLALSFNERNKRPKIQGYILSPPGQCVLLYHLLIWQLNGHMHMVGSEFGYSFNTIQRVVDELLELNLAKMGDRRSGRSFMFKYSDRELWEAAKPFLSSPINHIKSVVSIDDTLKVYKTKINALAEYADIPDVPLQTFAIGPQQYQEAKMYDEFTPTLNSNIQGDIALEVWLYNPGLLTKTDIVDPLSLYLAMQNINDERISMSLEKLINNIEWAKD
jgi:hypothetical protein